MLPVAFAPEPTAVEDAPVAAVDWQPAAPKLVPAPEKHCASAGETPSTVIMPAAAASPRSVPPVRMLLASRRARGRCRYVARSGSRTAALEPARHPPTI